MTITKPGIPKPVIPPPAPKETSKACDECRCEFIFNEREVKYSNYRRSIACPECGNEMSVHRYEFDPVKRARADQEDADEAQREQARQREAQAAAEWRELGGSVMTVLGWLVALVVLAAAVMGLISFWQSFGTRQLFQMLGCLTTLVLVVCAGASRDGGLWGGLALLAGVVTFVIW